MSLEEIAFYSMFSVTALKLVVGILFARHGYSKLFGKDAQKNTAAFFKSVGIPFSSFAAILVGSLEFFGGILILVSAFELFFSRTFYVVTEFLSRIISVLLALQMLVALCIVKFKLKRPFVGGWELDLLLIASLITLAIYFPAGFLR